MAISSKLSKAHQGFRVQFFDTGFLFELDGINTNEEGVTFRAAVPDLTALNALITEALSLPRV